MDGYSNLPADEQARLKAVHRYAILDTPPDGMFDRITALAARRLNVPIAIISIVDHDRIWFKSRHGVEAEQTDRVPGLCASAIVSSDPWIVLDAKNDVRTLANPLVAGTLGLQFYMGIPLRTSDGYNLGTLCVIDREPRAVSGEQIEDLKDLASMVMDQLEVRLSARQALEQADILSREIDHRVMNSLQFVASMLKMQARSSPADVADHLQTAAGRVLAVARVHQHFHLDGPSERVGCLPYLRRLCGDLASILQVDVKVQGANLQVSTKQIQPIGLIVNELVTNAVKHGGGNISVRLFSSGAGKFALSVLDEGEAVTHEFDPIGTSNGLGMRLLTALTQQLNGEVVDGLNPGGKGACFTITFPEM